jgi:hypothetical protein
MQLKSLIIKLQIENSMIGYLDSPILVNTYFYYRIIVQMSNYSLKRLMIYFEANDFLIKKFILKNEIIKFVYLFIYNFN